MDRKILQALKQRPGKTAQPGFYTDLPREFVSLIQKTREFKELSIMVIGEIFREIEVIELYRDEERDRERETELRRKEQERITVGGQLIQKESSFKTGTSNDYNDDDILRELSKRQTSLIRESSSEREEDDITSSPEAKTTIKGSITSSLKRQRTSNKVQFQNSVQTFEPQIARQQTIQVQDPVYLDFYLLLNGKCELTFHVTKVFDPYQTEEDLKCLTKEDLERREQGMILKRLGTKLNSLLVTPYFQTEFSEIKEENLLRRKDPNILKLAEDYLQDPDNEQQTFTAFAPWNKLQTISDMSIASLRPNYYEYYDQVYNIVKQQMANQPMAKFPRKVHKYEDKLINIRTLEQKSTLLRLPYKKMMRIVSSFWASYNQFADLLYNHVPLLTTYTLKQKQRMIETFQEDNFQPNQPIFKENTQLKFVYLIAKGSI